MGTHRGGLARRWHRAIGSGLLVIVGLLAACGVDDQGSGTALPPTVAVQELEPGLREAFRLANQGHITEARASLAMYMREAGVAANDYQAETLMAYCYQRSDRYEQARQHLERRRRAVQADLIEARESGPQALEDARDRPPLQAADVVADEPHLAFYCPASPRLYRPSWAWSPHQLWKIIFESSL